MKENYIQEDEIDLKELFKTFWDKKIFILIFTGVVTICAGVYVYFKNPISVYKGNVLVEIGEIQSENYEPTSFDNPINLSEILRVNYGVESIVPRGATKLIEISLVNSNKELIKQKLQTSVEFIINRHLDKAKFYKQFIMTQQVSSVIVHEEPINKPKKLLIIIISLISGFIISIFLVFFIQFIQSFRGEKND